jgi:transcriptional regulator
MQSLPETYLEGMLRGVVGLDNAVTRLGGKYKPSENRPTADRPRIVASLEAQAMQMRMPLPG